MTRINSLVLLITSYNLSNLNLLKIGSDKHLVTETIIGNVGVTMAELAKGAQEEFQVESSFSCFFT